MLCLCLWLAVLGAGAGCAPLRQDQSAQASQHSSIQTFKPSDANKQMKWDAGQKDLLASMESDAAKTTGGKEAPVYITILSFIFKLSLVAGLAYATIWVLKRFSGLKGSIGGKRTQIKVVENTSLAANRSLHLVEIGSKRLLVASTPGQISLLTELEAPSVGALESPSVSASQPTGLGTLEHSNVPSFAAQLSSLMGGKPDTGDAEKNIAALIRGTSALMQEKIMLVGRIRKELRDA